MNVHLSGNYTLWGTLEGCRQGLVRTPEKSEASNCYETSAGADSPKSALETEDHVLRAEHKCRASSGTITTWECTATQRETSLLLLWRQSDRQEQGVSSSGTPRTGLKTSSSWTRKSSPSRSSTTTRTTRFMLKCPVRLRKMFRGCREAITLPTSWFGGQCHLFIFARRGWNWCPSVSRGHATRSCETSERDALQWSGMGLPPRTQFLPKRPRQIRSGCGGTF